MYIIAENIHIISPKVKQAIAERDAKFFQDLAVRLVDAGASAIDLNIGPQKKAGHEILPWLVEVVEQVVDVPLVFDTTNLRAIEAACETVTKAQPIINSTDARPERLETVPALAKKYNTKLIALTMGEGMIPVSADERVSIALERLIPHMLEIDFPITDLIIDPLVLTVSGCQEYCPECIEAVRMLKFAWDPPPLTNAGLSNVSNAVPHEMRPLLNRTYMVMLMAAGLDMAIADPLDKDLMEWMRVVEERDDSTPLNRLILKLYDRVAAMEELQPEDVDMSDPEQEAVWKTVQVLLNKVIYTDAYLKL
ncbi:MAG TPA: dihydropteroate synthase DHPS [Anaerolineales bacterium]|nr:dihydropteroate synthase DHPS [Anaerolineae bacterium]HIP87789.1 dihydropteroate synthase DHPS [Anaerolineales bacterium]